MGIISKVNPVFVAKNSIQNCRLWVEYGLFAGAMRFFVTRNSIRIQICRKWVINRGNAVSCDHEHNTDS